MAVSAQHSKSSGEWYTPAPIVDAAREALGGVIDLDPATCVLAQERVKARVIGTMKHPATIDAWRNARTVFLNPPTPPRNWWDMLSVWFDDSEAGVGRTRAVYVAYSIEQIQQSHRWHSPMLSHRVIIPERRIAYDQTREAAIEKIDLKIEALESYDQVYGIQANSKEATLMSCARIKRKMLETGPALVPGDAPPHAGAVILLGDVDPKPLLAVLGGSLVGRVK